MKGKNGYYSKHHISPNITLKNVADLALNAYAQAVGNANDELNITEQNILINDRLEREFKGLFSRELLWIGEEEEEVPKIK